MCYHLPKTELCGCEVAIRGISCKPFQEKLLFCVTNICKSLPVLTLLISAVESQGHKPGRFVFVTFSGDVCLPENKLLLCQYASQKCKECFELRNPSLCSAALCNERIKVLGQLSLTGAPVVSTVQAVINGQE